MNVQQARPTGEPRTAEADRLLNTIEQQANEAIDSGRDVNAPWLLSVVREMRAAAATEPRPDPALDVEAWIEAFDAHCDHCMRNHRNRQVIERCFREIAARLAGTSSTPEPTPPLPDPDLLDTL